MKKRLVSVVIPVLNEADNITRILSQPLLQNPQVEVIVVDGGSSDDTCDIVQSCETQNVSLVNSEKGRAKQMNAGAAHATAPIILFLHADTMLPGMAMDHIHQLNQSDKVWGRFDIELDEPGLPFRIITWFINKRSRLTGISTGDQAMFMRTALFQAIGGFPDQPLMEDVELAKRLKQHSPPLCISNRAITSARKWKSEGVVRTVWLMWRLRASYALGSRPEELVRQYYK